MSPVTVLLGSRESQGLGQALLSGKVRCEGTKVANSAAEGTGW